MDIRFFITFICHKFKYWQCKRDMKASNCDYKTNSNGKTQKRLGKEELFADVLQNSYSENFYKIHSKIPVLESLFNKVADLPNK